MCNSPAYELYSTYLFIKDNKPRFVDLGDEVSELLLKLERRNEELDIAESRLVNLERSVGGFR